MSFIVLKPGAKRAIHPVCCGLSKRKNKGAVRNIIVVTLSAQVCADLKWKVGDFIEIAAGEGPDHGYVRFRPANEGYRLKQGPGSRPRLEFNYWAEADRYALGRCDCRPDTVGRSLVIALPWVERKARAA